MMFFKKNLFSFFANYFRNNIDTPNNIISNKINKKTPDATGNSITFSLDNNDPYITIKIEDTSNENCYRFADLLYGINKGIYNESILDLMLKMTNNNDEHITKFIHSTILYWTYLSKEIDSANNYPIIMPTDFNKNAK